MNGKTQDSPSIVWQAEPSSIIKKTQVKDINKFGVGAKINEQKNTAENIHDVIVIM